MDCLKVQFKAFFPFLLFVNDMSQTVYSEPLSYSDDTCLTYTGKDSEAIEDQQDKEVNSLCDWFILPEPDR